MAKERVLVLCSGGLNGAVTATIASHEHALAMLHVRFGHRAAAKEAGLFEKQAEFYGAQDKLVVELPHFAQIGGNGRVSRKLHIEDAMALGEGKSNGYIPGLVGALLGVGFSWASVLGVQKIYLGVSEDLGPPGPRTSGVYPDYSREYVELCKHAFEVGSPAKPISIETPVIDLSRSEIVKLGNRLGTPFDITWSCISSNSEPCGGCLGCATRNRGFLDAAIPDPILGDFSHAGAERQSASA